MSCPGSIFDKFSEWERRGRGWQLWPAPVELEPPFEPFTGYFELGQCSRVDDGRKPTILTKFVDGIRELLHPGSTQPSHPKEEPHEEAEPHFLSEEANLSFIHAILPPDFPSSKVIAEQFLGSLSKCGESLAFEIVSTAGAINLQFACPQQNEEEIVEQLENNYPTGSFLAGKDFLKKSWGENEEFDGFCVEFGLGQEFTIPFVTPSKFAPDPLVGVIGALSQVRSGEVAVLQILFKGTVEPWAESIVRLVTTWNGRPIFSNAPEMVRQAREKLSSQLFSVVIRLGLRASDERFRILARSVMGALSVIASPGGNEFIPLHNEDYEWEAHERDLLARQSCRSGMLLNRDELSFFVHLPDAEVKNQKLVRNRKKTKRAPDFVRGGGVVLGINSHVGKDEVVRLDAELRTRHAHVVGMTGMGKSTLLYRLILDDILNGQGVGVLDPHGDLIDRILGVIPETRIKDVIVFDPSDETFSIGFNILSAHSDFEKTLLASDLVSIFKRLSTSWGDQMGSVFNNAILAFLESSQGGTLADLRRFLLDPAFRNQFLATVHDPDIAYYWRKGFPQLGGNKSIGPILTRLESFLAPKAIRCMVSQKSNRLDFASILDSGKIFLAKLPQGQIGAENAFLLGSLLVAKFQQTAMSRQRMEASRRRDFWLYIDEVHNFITPSMAEIITGARKYRLGLVLAHQELRQLERDPEVAGAVMSSCATRVVFRVGDTDAKALATGFSAFEASDLQSLDRGEAICRVGRIDQDFNLRVVTPKEPSEAEARATKAKTIAASRSAYATPRSEFEAALLGVTRAATATDELPMVPRLKKNEKPVAITSQLSDLSTIEGEPVGSESPVPMPNVARNRNYPIFPPTLQPKDFESDSPILPSTESVSLLSGRSIPDAIPVLGIPAPRKRREVVIIPSLGRGGPQHKYLQHLIAQFGSRKGFETDIEKTILDGAGSVDVELRRGDKRFAFEISVTTSAEHEFENIQKCLSAGYDFVATIGPEHISAQRIKEVAAKYLSGADLEKCRFCTPDDLVRLLAEFAATTESKNLVSHGKKTKLTYKALKPEDAEKVRSELAKITTGSIKTLTKRSS